MSAVLDAAPVAPPVHRGIATQRFVPRPVHPSRLRRTVDHLRWPLGIYTTGVV